MYQRSQGTTNKGQCHSSAAIKEILEKKFNAIVKAGIFNEVSVVQMHFKKRVGEKKLRLFPASLLQHFTYPGLENFSHLRTLSAPGGKFSAGIR